MRRITKAKIETMAKLERVQLATSLTGPKPICLVGTMDSSGQRNLAPFSSVVHYGSNPALLGLVTRPDTVERHTLSNIRELGCYTLNHLHPEILEQGHQCGARYPRDVSEFDATGLTPIESDGFVSVSESRLRIGLRLAEEIPIEINATRLILGTVEWVEVAADALQPDGSIDLEALEVVASTALDTYFRVTQIARLPYAKV